MLPPHHNLILYRTATLPMTEPRTRETKRLAWSHSVPEAGRNRQSPRSVPQVLSTEPTSLDGTVPSLPLTKISKSSPGCMFHDREMWYNEWADKSEVSGKATTRDAFRKQLHINRKLLFTCYTSYVAGIKNMTLVELNWIFSRRFSTLPRKSLIRNARVLSAGRTSAWFPSVRGNG